jgi:molybdopterin converting factor small subunit
VEQAIGTITLRLFGSLRHAVGSREIELPCTKPTLREALEEFTASHTPGVSGMIFDKQGNLWSSLILLLNEEPAADGPQTRVKPGDVVSVLMPLAGG